MARRQADRSGPHAAQAAVKGVDATVMAGELAGAMAGDALPTSRAREGDALAGIVPLFKALADEKRIRIVALIAARPLSVDEIAVAVDLTSATISHHLALLRAAGLVEAAREQYYTVYRFRQQPLLDALRALADQPATPELDEDLAKYDRKVLRDYLVDGALKTIPTQRKKRDVILRYLAEQFEPGRVYTEKEVNQVLVAYHDDVATLRRELVQDNPRFDNDREGASPAGGASAKSGRLLARENGRYWRVAE